MIHCATKRPAAATSFRTLLCASLLVPALSTGCALEEDAMDEMPADEQIVDVNSDQSARADSDAERAFPGVTGEVRTDWFATAHGPMELSYELIDGQRVFEGDILLSKPIAAEDLDKSAGRTLLSSRWPDRIVPFLIDPTLPAQNRVTDAIAHWEARSSIRFVARTTETDYVVFQPSSGGSTSTDTLLGLYNASGVAVAVNDDKNNRAGTCAQYGSHLSYTVPEGQGASFEIRAGCYDNHSCNGTVGYRF